MHLQIPIRLRGGKRPQDKSLHALIDARPHRRDVDAPVGGNRGDDAFEDHASARSNPSALCQVSSYSRSGTESATMPPPTGNCTQPRPMVNVRIRMLVSIVPSNPM